MSPGVQRSRRGCGVGNNIPISEYPGTRNRSASSLSRFSTIQTLFTFSAEESLNPKINLTSVCFSDFSDSLPRYALLKQLLTAGLVNYVTVPDELAQIGPNQPISWSDCNTDSEDLPLTQIKLYLEIAKAFTHFRFSLTNHFSKLFWFCQFFESRHSTEA